MWHVHFLNVALRPTTFDPLSIFRILHCSDRFYLFFMFLSLNIFTQSPLFNPISSNNPRVIHLLTALQNILHLILILLQSPIEYPFPVSAMRPARLKHRHYNSTARKSPAQPTQSPMSSSEAKTNLNKFKFQTAVATRSAPASNEPSLTSSYNEIITQSCYETNERPSAIESISRFLLHSPRSLHKVPRRRTIDLFAFPTPNFVVFLFSFPCCTPFPRSFHFIPLNVSMCLYAYLCSCVCLWSRGYQIINRRVIQPAAPRALTPPPTPPGLFSNLLNITFYFRFPDSFPPTHSKDFSVSQPITRGMWNNRELYTCSPRVHDTSIYCRVSRGQNTVTIPSFHQHHCTRVALDYNTPPAAGAGGLRVLLLLVPSHSVPLLLLLPRICLI